MRLFNNFLRSPVWGRVPLNGAQVLVGAAAGVAVAGGVVFFWPHEHHDKSIEISSQSRRTTRYVPSPAQWATLKVEPVAQQVFSAEHVTEGKIAVDEDRTTPIFSP